MIIILNGLDRCGKDTQANEIKKFLEKHDSNPTHIIHSRKVDGSNKDQAQKNAESTFEDLFKLMIEDNGRRNLILNRSYLDEAVYGPIYRNEDNLYIYDLEKKYLPCISEEVYAFFLKSMPKTLISREDGDSFSNTISSKEKETNLFLDVFNKSLITNKYIIDADRSISEVTND